MDIIKVDEKNGVFTVARPSVFSTFRGRIFVCLPEVQNTMLNMSLTFRSKVTQPRNSINATLSTDIHIWRTHQLWIFNKWIGLFNKENFVSIFTTNFFFCLCLRCVCFIQCIWNGLSRKDETQCHNKNVHLKATSAPKIKHFNRRKQKPTKIFRIC